MQLLLILLGAGVLGLIALVISWLRRHGEEVATWMEGDSGECSVPTCCLENDRNAPKASCCHQPEEAEASCGALVAGESRRGGLSR